MKKSVDYRAKYEQEMRELEEAVKNDKTIKPDLKRLKLTFELADVENSQYKRIQNKDKCYKLEKVYYPMFCEMAELSGGLVELEISEDCFHGVLLYRGKEIQVFEPFVRTLHGFTDAVDAAECIYMGAEEGEFILQLQYDLSYKIFSEDHSKQIADVKMKIERYNIEKFFPESFNGEKKKEL